MTCKKEQKYCRNAEQLARAFGLPLSPRKRRQSLAKAQGWIASPDFPAKVKGKKAWLLEDVRLWLRLYTADGQHVAGLNHAPTAGRKNGPELPGFEDGDTRAGPITEALLDLWEDKIRRPELHLESPIQKWQMEKLEAARPRLFSHNRTPGSQKNDEAEKNESQSGFTSAATGGETLYGADGRLMDCESQKALSLRLSLHFQGRTCIDISEQQISRWKTSADELPSGVPPPPPKLGNRWPTQLWATWFEQHMLPHYPYRAKSQGTLPGVGDLTAQAREAEQKERIYSAGVAEIKFKAISGAYIAMDKARNARRGALKLQHGIFRRSLENEDCRARQDWLQARLPPNDLLLFVEFDKGLARARVDFVENEYARALAMEPERQIAREAQIKT